MSGELLMNIILLGVLFILFVEAQRIPSGLMVESVQREVGADFWPKVLLMALILLMLALTIKYLVLHRGSRSKGKKIAHEKENWFKCLLVILSIIIFILIQYLVGFIIAISIFTGINLYIMEWRKRFSLVIISLSIAFLLTLTFGRFLYVPFPKGVGVFRSISQIFY